MVVIHACVLVVIHPCVLVLSQRLALVVQEYCVKCGASRTARAALFAGMVPTHPACLGVGAERADGV